MAGKRRKASCHCHHVFPEPAGIIPCKRPLDLQVPQDLSRTVLPKLLQELPGVDLTSCWGCPGTRLSFLQQWFVPPPLVTPAQPLWLHRWLSQEVPPVICCLRCHVIPLLFLYGSLLDCFGGGGVVCVCDYFWLVTISTRQHVPQWPTSSAC